MLCGTGNRSNSLVSFLFGIHSFSASSSSFHCFFLNKLFFSTHHENIHLFPLIQHQAESNPFICCANNCLPFFLSFSFCSYFKRAQYIFKGALFISCKTKNSKLSTKKLATKEERERERGNGKKFLSVSVSYYAT